MALMITLGRHVPEQEHSLPGLARRNSTALGLTKPDWAYRHPAVSCGGVEMRPAGKHPTMQPIFAAAAAAAAPALGENASSKAHTHTHTYIHTYIYIYVYICMNEEM